jgi:hypothetical protein
MRAHCICNVTEEQLESATELCGEPLKKISDGTYEFRKVFDRKANAEQWLCERARELYKGSGRSDNKIYEDVKAHGMIMYNGVQVGIIKEATLIISKEIIEGIRIGELTDDQLDEAIAHYTLLEKLLDVHGDKYFLVWKDVYYELMRLKSYKASRTKNRNNEARNNQT